jgi:hypothetical protein
MFIITGIILIILSFFITRRIGRAFNDICGSFVVSFFVTLFAIMISGSILNATMDKEVTQIVKYDIISTIKHSCNAQGEELSFFTNHDNNSLVTVTKRDVEIHMSSTGKSYITAESHKIMWKDWVIKVQNLDDNIPKGFWVWPINHQDFYTWQWDGLCSNTDIYLTKDMYK